MIIRTASRIANGLEWFMTKIAFVGGCVVVLMMIAVGREVIGRYLFNNPSDWSQELCENLLVILVFLGGAWVLQINAHIRADVFYRKFPPRTKDIADILISLMALAYVGMITYQSTLYSHHLFTQRALSSGMMWPLFPVQLMVPIGGVLVCLECLIILLRATGHLILRRGS